MAFYSLYGKFKVLDFVTAKSPGRWGFEKLGSYEALGKELGSFTKTLPR